MKCNRQQPLHPKIDLAELKNDPNSFLSLRFDDPILHKLETYRLYRRSFPVVDLAEAFGFARAYLHQMWRQFETRGTIALVNKHWGSVARKLTTEQEAAIIRAKALTPKRSDTDLAQEFGLNRTTVYRLLKEHGLQDLHRVISRPTSSLDPNHRTTEKSVRKRKQQSEV